MDQIAKFFTLYWIIYFPTCIAFNDLPGFSSIDEAMTGLIVVYALFKRGHWSTTHYVWREYFMFIGIIAFYTVYGLMYGRNPNGVWLDFIQEIRPYSVIYCTWILNPQFSERQKKWMLGSMVATLFVWIYTHADELGGGAAENPVIGQLAICCGMAWYLFRDESLKTSYIALALVCTGMLAPKFKFLGELVCFVTLLFVIKKKIDFNNPKIVAGIVLMIAAVIYVTWTKFDAYFVAGAEEDLARPATYRTAFGKILWDYFPFGPGMGTFACNGAWKYYSPLYHEYKLDHIWGLDRGGGFICDAYYPSLVQFGVVGVGLFLAFWRKRFNEIREIMDMRYYRIALLTLFCLIIEQTADSSLLSGKGMGYCMIIGLCLCSNINDPDLDDEDDEDDEDDLEPLPDEVKITPNFCHDDK